MAELADALDSGSSFERCEGSNPFDRTIRAGKKSFYKGEFMAFGEIIPNQWGEYFEHQKSFLEELAKKYNLTIDDLRVTPFVDPDLVEEFMWKIKPEEQEKHFHNTCSYHGLIKEDGKKEYDKNYVLVSRRAVVTDQDKPERFWTDEHQVARLGLRTEINGAQRHHSEILISTLGNLDKHQNEATKKQNEDDWAWDEKYGGASDGEIRISGQPFKKEFLLFHYKPIREKLALKGFLENGGQTKEAFVAEMIEQMAHIRAEQRGEAIHKDKVERVSVNPSNDKEDIW